MAMYRALESERADALFKDPLTRVLAGGKGEMFVEVIGKKDKITNAMTNILRMEIKPCYLLLSKGQNFFNSIIGKLQNLYGKSYTNSNEG
ncbi:hypothetical protein [Nostoc punctiforme]|uniref:hypothetical protein n=1 Tax=Nostoc punctiforme TaxID=272131 RepID=UPI0030EEA752